MREPFPDELGLAGSEHLDPAYVDGYDGKAGFDAGPDIELLVEHGLGADSVLVDLGAGTGTFALAAAGICRRVVAVDVSEPMLDALRRRVVSAGFDNVECVRAGFLGYEHVGEPADVVFTRHALHHLPDTWKAVALARVRDLLRPGGLLRLRDLAWSFDPADAERQFALWLDGAADDPSRGWTRAELATHIRTEHSTYTWLLEPMLERAGFAIEQAAYSGPGVYAEYLCVRRD